ncbi:hypothetical protein HaLaN_16789, partial [Haematococcus lacustris]
MGLQSIACSAWDTSSSSALGRASRRGATPLLAAVLSAQWSQPAALHCLGEHAVGQPGQHTSPPGPAPGPPGGLPPCLPGSASAPWLPCPPAAGWACGPAGGGTQGSALEAGRSWMAPGWWPPAQTPAWRARQQLTTSQRPSTLTSSASQHRCACVRRWVCGWQCTQCGSVQALPSCSACIL